MSTGCEHSIGHPGAKRWTLALLVSLPPRDLTWTWSHVYFLKLSPTSFSPLLASLSYCLPYPFLPDSLSLNPKKQSDNIGYFLEVPEQRNWVNPEAFREQSETRNWVHRLTTNFYLATCRSSNDGQGPWHWRLYWATGLPVLNMGNPFDGVSGRHTWRDK